MTEEIRLGQIVVNRRGSLPAPAADQELRLAVEKALAEYSKEERKALPTVDDFEIREEHSDAGVALLYVFLKAAAAAGGSYLGKKATEALWVKVSGYLRDSTTANVEVTDDKQDL